MPESAAESFSGVNEYETAMSNKKPLKSPSDAFEELKKEYLQLREAAAEAAALAYELEKSKRELEQERRNNARITAEKEHWKAIVLLQGSGS